MARVVVRPSHRPIQAYHEAISLYRQQGVRHELALRSAFQNLLSDTARMAGWIVIPELSTKSAAGDANIRPDATLRDANTLPRGYWEAKSPSEDLAKEIAKKKARGYSLVNTIFENTTDAILFQNGQERFRAKLSDPSQVADLLTLFLSHTEPDFEDWEKAVEDFKNRVPELAKGLLEVLRKAHIDNGPFQEAFSKFFALCQNAIDPNISQPVVDEMLVQHLLTERLFRTIFNLPDFISRNIIATEVDEVTKALASQSFSKTEFLKALDRFYIAIEAAASHLEFKDKQHFLNVVYERFFHGYCVKTADAMGVVYTPQPIVDFMCASVEHVLKQEFGLSLSDKDVRVLDPCTGTGNFIVNLIRRVPPRDLKRVYGANLFANEIMLLPYYIAAMNIEHVYFEQTKKYEPFEGLCFVDTLDMAEHVQQQFDFFTQKNTERVERQKRARITVILGNPPYNAEQEDENDLNPNRRYAVIDERIQRTYAKSSQGTLKNKLYDPYVKFFRWASDRLGDREGIVCFITNNNFVVDSRPFDGMRHHIAEDFSCIYHLDLNGNVRKNPKLSGSKHNVFGIQTGVGITIAIRRSKRKECKIRYHRLPEEWTRYEKLNYLNQAQSVAGVQWTTIAPDIRKNWITFESSAEFDAFVPLRAREEEHVFADGATGAKSNRDAIVLNFSKRRLSETVEQFVEAYNAEADRFRRKPESQPLQTFLRRANPIVQWSSGLLNKLQRGQYATYDPACIRMCLYRPFTKMWLYYDEFLNDRPGIFRSVFPKSQDERENVAIYCTSHSQQPFAVQVVNCIANEAAGGRPGVCYPFYLCQDDQRRENISDSMVQKFRQHYGDKRISKWDVFHYTYAILHHEEYRERFAQRLQQDQPRIPFARDFKPFSHAGRELVKVHLNYESASEYPLTEIVTPGLPRSPLVHGTMKLSRDKASIQVNDSLLLTGIPADALRYRLGNRSALEWVIAQYQAREDERGEIASDANAWGAEHGDPEYILRLIGKVISVSMHTSAIVDSLPRSYREFQPVELVGEPLSRTLLEDRR